MPWCFSSFSSPWREMSFSFSSVRQNFSKHGGISRSIKQEQAAPWKIPVSWLSREVRNQRAFSLPGIPVSQRHSTSLKRPAENSPKKRFFVFYFSPWEKRGLHSLPLTKPYIFLTGSWMYFWSVSYKSVCISFSLLVHQPAEGLILYFYFTRVGDDVLLALGSS